MNNEKRLQCFEHWLKSIANQDVENYTPEKAKKQLEQIVGISGCVLRDPSIMDPVRQKEDREKAMAAYKRGDFMTSEELKKKLDEN